ncbi:MAG: hypothetical protein K0R17_2467 [Rariglobus sp.]|nr:hypothetical protein [Rariglobus sp.]
MRSLNLWWVGSTMIILRKLLLQTVLRADERTELMAGNSKAAKTPTMAMTVRSSTSVNAEREADRGEQGWGMHIKCNT